MQKYCNIVKNKLNTLIQNMEENVSAFVANPKRDFVRIPTSIDMIAYIFLIDNE